MRMLDRVEEALEILEHARAPAEAGNLAEELASLHHLRGNLYFPQGEFEKCLVEHEIALKWARKAGSREAEARSLGGLGDASYLTGRMRTAHQRFSECVELSERHGFAEVQVANMGMVGWTGAFIDPLEQVLEASQSAVELAAKMNRPKEEAIARGLIGYILIELGEFDHAAEEHERGLEAASNPHVKRFAPLNLWGLGKIAYLKGNHAEAIEVGERALQICRETAMGYLGAMVLGFLARVTADSAAQGRALAEAQELLSTGCVSHNHIFVHRDAIETWLAREDWAEAERHATALEIYTRAEPFPWSEFIIARCLALVNHGRSGPSEEEAIELERLRGVAQQMGYRQDLPAIERALAKR